MNEILFRGKRKDNGEWVEGFLFRTQEHTYIAYAEQFDDDLFLSPKNIFVEVIPETIGQFTGLLDKNGTKIFEGDIVNVVYTEKRNYQGVKFDDEFEMIETVVYYEKHACFMLEINDGGIPLVRPLHDFKSKIKIKEIEVIGNKWDNS